MKACAALAVLLSAAAAATAQDVQVTGHAGWGGRFRPGEWTPIALDLDNRGEKIQEVRLLVCWAGPRLVQDSPKPKHGSLNGRTGPLHELPVRIAGNARMRLSVAILAPENADVSAWAFAISSRGQQLSSAELFVRAVDPGTRLVAIAGSERPPGLDTPGTECASLQPENLPEDRRGYDSLDALVWLDADAGRFRSQAQIDALKTWVSCGGHVAFARANMVGIGGTALESLLPVAPRGSAEVERLWGLAYAPIFETSPEGKAVVLQASVTRGKAAVVQGDAPLVVAAPTDGGRVTFVAFDPAAGPFAQWAGAPRFWAWLLPRRAGGPEPESRPPRPIGSVELARQAARFPGVSGPPIGTLFLTIVVFLAAAGPADYFLLRLARRLELTWITFPAYVIAFTGFLLVSGGALLRSSAHQREIAVADHYPETGFARRRAVEAILAPWDMTFRLEGQEPLTGNFLGERWIVEEMSGVTVLHDGGAKARGWTLLRGRTGLAIADRSSREPSPVSYTIHAHDAGGADLTVRNESGMELDQAALLTPSGVYLIDEIRRGTRRLTARFVASDLSPSQWISRLPTHRPPERPLDLAGPRPQEEEMNDEAARLLLRLSFADRGAEAHAFAGFARDLDARGWLAAGGSVLVGRARGPERQERFDPRPGVLTSVLLVRVFQGPGS